MLQFIQTIMNLGAVIILPLFMTILGLIFGLKPGKSIKAGLMVGIGFQGLQLIIGLLMSTVEPAINYYKGLETSGFTTVDVGWAAMGASSWSVPFAALAILLIVVVNLVLVLTKKTKVLNVDIWNYIHFLIPGTLAYALTNNAIVGLLVTTGLSIISLYAGEKIAPKWVEYYELEGTTCTTFSFITFTYPFAVFLNRIIDKIPGLKNIDFSLETVNEKFGFFGDTAIIGAIVGIILGLITKQDWQTMLIMGMGISAVLVLIPKMVSIMMEGLTAVGNGAQKFVSARIGDDYELYIGMDIALGLGDPTAITTTVLMIPLAILFAFIIPNMTYFPVGLLTVIVYFIPLIAMASKGNLFRTILCSALFLFVVEVCTNIFAPEATMMMHATGVSVEGMVTDGFFGFNLANIVISILGRLFI